MSVCVCLCVCVSVCVSVCLCLRFLLSDTEVCVVIISFVFRAIAVASSAVAALRELLEPTIVVCGEADCDFLPTEVGDLHLRGRRLVDSLLLLRRSL